MAILGISTAVAPAEANTEACRCDQYRGLVPYSSLIDDFTRIGSAALTSNGRSFETTEQDRKMLRLRETSRRMVPEECWDQLGLNDAYRKKIVARGQLIGPDPLGLAVSDAKWIVKSYLELASIYDHGCEAMGFGPDYKAAYERCASQNGKKAIENLSVLLDWVDVKDYPLYLGRFDSTGGLKRMTLEELEVLKHYHNVVRGGSAKAALKYLDENYEGMSIRQRLLLSQMVMGRAEDGYDKERRADAVSAAGKVDLDTQLEAIRHNDDIGWSGSKDDNRAVIAYIAGICRDIASGGAELNRAMGIESYVLAFATTGTSYHATVVSKDPHDPNVVHHQNYAKGHDVESHGSAALVPSKNDASLSYRLAVPAGPVVAVIQSEFGKVMSEAAGFDIRSLDPLHHSAASFAGAETALDKYGNVRARVGAATDPVGANYGFAATTVSYGDGTWAPGKLGAVVAHQDRSHPSFGSEDPSTTKSEKPADSLEMLYAQLEQKFRSVPIKLGDRFSLKLESTFIAILAGQRAIGGKDDKEFNAQGDMRLNVDATVAHEIIRNRLTAIYRAGLQTSVGVSDIRDLSTAPDFFINHVLLSAEARAKLAETRDGEIYLTALAMVLMDHLGERGRFEAGILAPHGGFTVQLEGRLTDDTAPFKDGSERRVSGNLIYRPTNALEFNLTGYQSLETFGGPGANDRVLGAMGGVTVKY